MIRYFIVILFFVVLSCGSTFDYRWYGLQLDSYENGKLLGPEPEEDLNIKVCKPDEVEQGKCVVILIDEFNRIVEDVIILKKRLEACESK